MIRFTPHLSMLKWDTLTFVPFIKASPKCFVQRILLCSLPFLTLPAKALLLTLLDYYLTFSGNLIGICKKRRWSGLRWSIEMGSAVCDQECSRLNLGMLLYCWVLHQVLLKQQLQQQHTKWWHKDSAGGNLWYFPSLVCYSWWHTVIVESLHWS